MTARRAALVLAFAAVALVLPFVPAPPDVHATCGEPSADISDLFSISPPAPNLTLQGEAPFQVVITFADKTVESGPLTMSVSWGDGAVGQVTIVLAATRSIRSPRSNCPTRSPARAHTRSSGT